MIVGNILKFGYGDISVGSDGFFQIISFQQFKPPVECGSKVCNKDVEFIGDKIVLDISYEDYCELKKRLSLMSKEVNAFDFKGYIFDFSNYNAASVNVVTRHLEKCMQFYFLCLAC